jgi:hypothetical protein
MLQQLRRFHDSFHDSEIIVWARLQFMFGSAFVALQGVDMSVFISDRHMLMGYIFFNGLVTEVLRRNREDWKQVTVPEDK